MEIREPYNPLDKRTLGMSVADAFLAKAISPLPPVSSFEGAGIYAIYYAGNLPLYRPLADRNQGDKSPCPIYVGRAIPKGARKGGVGWDRPPGRALFSRLNGHAKSIKHAGNLDLADFTCRYLIVDDVWIPLGESLLIDMFCPLWNQVIDGFGNNTPGQGREKQKLSPWDILHSGRRWAANLPQGRERGELEKTVRAFFESEKFKNSMV